VAVGIAAVAFGVFLRLWLVANTPLNSDEAVVGLMAKQAVHGHFTTFYWGQSYGGVEPYVVAALFAPFGAHVWVVKVVPAIFTAIGLVVLWRVGRRIFGPSTAVVAALLVAWIWPESNIRNSVQEYGFRGVVWLCGVLVLLTVIRITGGGYRRSDWAVLGASAGIGWWAGPEILYFLAPAGLAVGAWFVGRPPVRRLTLVPGLLVALGTGVVGALPWFYTNVTSHWPSLDLGSHFNGGSYGGRLHIFFAKTLPMVLGTRVLPTGAWLGGRAGTAVYAVALVVVVAAGAFLALRVPRARILVLFLGIFPFLYSAFPTDYWRDGRFAVYLSPVVALVVFGAGSLVLGRVRLGHPGRWWLAPGLAGIVVALAAVSSVQSLRLTTDFGRRPFALRPSRTEAVPSALAATLTDHRLTDVYAHYWVAYVLDFVGNGSVTATPPDAIRSRSIYRSVVSAPRSAWVFASARAGERAEAQSTFGSDQLEPYDLTAPQFSHTLDRGHVPYVTIESGPMVVVVPGTPVTPSGLYSIETRSHL